MDRLRWRIVKVDDRLVRVLQYWEPGEGWRDIFTADPDAKAALRQVPDCSAGMQEGISARVIDLERYRSRRKR